MKSEVVRIAKIEAEKAIILEIMRNPVVELLAGIVAISYLNKGPRSTLETITGIDLAAGGEFAGLVTIIGLQQIAPLAPAIAQGSAGLFKSLPSMLALGAAV